MLDLENKVGALTEEGLWGATEESEVIEALSAMGYSPGRSGGDEAAFSRGNSRRRKIGALLKVLGKNDSPVSCLRFPCLPAGERGMIAMTAV